MSAGDKVKKFFRIATKYMGKDIAIPSNNTFDINYVVDKQAEMEGIRKYTIQYGFPQSGCVYLSFSVMSEENRIGITSLSVYAPPADQEMIIANYNPEIDAGGLGISFKVGLDNGTIEHESLDEIENNPNAMQMLDIAIEDLSKAEVLGECMEISSDEDIIPCCSTNPYKEPHIKP